MKYIIKFISKCEDCEFFHKGKNANYADCCFHDKVVGMEAIIDDPTAILKVCPLMDVF